MALFKTMEEVGLLLTLVHSSPQFSRRILRLSDYRIMTGRNKGDSLFLCMVEKMIELDHLVANSAGVGSESLEVSFDERLDHPPGKHFLQMDIGDRNLQAIFNPSNGILSFRSFDGRRREQEMQPLDLPALLLEQGGGKSAIPSPAERDKD